MSSSKINGDSVSWTVPVTVQRSQESPENQATASSDQTKLIRRAAAETAGRDCPRGRLPMRFKTFETSNNARKVKPVVRTYLILMSTALAAACAEVVDERQSTITVQGKSYPVITQTLRSGNRTYDVSRVRTGVLNRQCDINLTGDCEAAAREALNPANRGPS